ncbi:DUF2505 domain-containing protein [Thalassiella azotivora]
MRIQEQVRYPATPDAVAAALADPRFSDRVTELMGASEGSVDVDGDPAGPFTVTTVRRLPTDDFPDVARSFVGATVQVRQVDAWAAPAPDGSRAGTISVEIVGAPLRLTGTLHLAPDGDSTVQSVDGDLKASVPLLGGKLERAAEPAVHGAIRQQIRAGREWLS